MSTGPLFKTIRSLTYCPQQISPHNPRLILLNNRSAMSSLQWRGRCFVVSERGPGLVGRFLRVLIHWVLGIRSLRYRVRLIALFNKLWRENWGLAVTRRVWSCGFTGQLGFRGSGISIINLVGLRGLEVQGQQGRWEKPKGEAWSSGMRI